MAKGFAYLVPILALYSVKGLSLRGRWVDSVFVERLWRRVDFDDHYTHTHESVRGDKVVLGSYFSFHNARCPHRTLQSPTPDEMYFRTGGTKKAA